MRIVVVLIWSATALFAQGKPPATLVPEPYRQKFVRYVETRTIAEKALNVIGLTTKDVGKSYALIAGVSKYPNMPKGEQDLPAAAADMEALRIYLTEQEFFDEIVVLRDADVTGDNLEYFLQNYFPERLRSSPKARFLFAYSGHGMAEGKGQNPTGFLLKSTARNLEDKPNGINMTVLRAYLQEVVNSGYQTLALINACQSGAFASRSSFGTIGGPRTAGGLYVPKYGGAHAITAGGSNQLTWHDPKLGKGSVFFEKLLAGLGGQADVFPIYPDGHRGDGVITVDEIHTFLREEVSFATNQSQTPVFVDLALNRSQGGFFFLSRQKMVANNIVPAWPPEGGIPAGLATKLKVGDSKTNDKDLLIYKYVPAGTFLMGCSKGDELDCPPEEKPAHRVVLSNGFWLGQTEVTVEAYLRYGRAAGKAMPPEPRTNERSLNPAWRLVKTPIVNVTWDEAQGFCQWTGGRLPTEAEWEYAARGSTAGPTYGELQDVAWYASNSGGRIHGVGEKTPNAYGLHDMLGNAWEWVADWYERYRPGPGVSDPKGPLSANFRTLRGGSWRGERQSARATARNADEASHRDADIGFRCVLEANPAQ